MNVLSIGVALDGKKPARVPHPPGDDSWINPRWMCGQPFRGTLNRVMKRPPPMDIAIAGALTIAGQLNLWLGFDGYYPGGPRALNVVLTLVATGALAFRRQAPLAVFGVEFVTFPLARTLGAGMTFWGSFVPFFVATGTVAAEESSRRRY